MLAGCHSTQHSSHELALTLQNNRYTQAEAQRATASRPPCAPCAPQCASARVQCPCSGSWSCGTCAIPGFRGANSTAGGSCVPGRRVRAALARGYGTRAAKVQQQSWPQSGWGATAVGEAAGDEHWVPRARRRRAVIAASWRSGILAHQSSWRMVLSRSQVKKKPMPGGPAA